jgi:hypothetical protein
MIEMDVFEPSIQIKVGSTISLVSLRISTKEKTQRRTYESAAQQAHEMRDSEHIPAVSAINKRNGPVGIISFVNDRNGRLSPKE